MRQFRGKRVDNDEWVYGCYVDSASYNAHCIVVKYEDTLSDGGQHVYEDYFEVKRETVGQFTGKKDVERKGVFAGDIIDPMFDSGSKGTHLLEVFWDEKRLMFNLKPLSGGITAYVLSGLAPEDFKIIGTIHDNEAVRKENV